MRRVVRSRAGGPYRRLRTVSALSAVAACCYTGNGSDIRNTAIVDSLTRDPRPANNTSAAAGPPGGTVKDPTADLQVGKTTP
ncbi:hypothetical protein ACIQV3_07390 [Streptomyces sp. NPDC099050]|uniref:hypothetical protein n=1 Tax=Streptomyces sp. NPDC099050 TaxID=3366100 RepID=UPI003816EDBE